MTYDISPPPSRPGGNLFAQAHTRRWHRQTGRQPRGSGRGHVMGVGHPGIVKKHLDYSNKNLLVKISSCIPFFFQIYVSGFSGYVGALCLNVSSHVSGTQTRVRVAVHFVKPRTRTFSRKIVGWLRDKKMTETEVHAWHKSFRFGCCTSIERWAPDSIGTQRVFGEKNTFCRRPGLLTE